MAFCHVFPSLDLFLSKRVGRTIGFLPCFSFPGLVPTRGTLVSVVVEHLLSTLLRRFRFQILHDVRLDEDVGNGAAGVGGGRSRVHYLRRLRGARAACSLPR